MELVGLSGNLELRGIIDARTAKLESKHSQVAFDAALEAARRSFVSLKPEE